MIRASFLLIEVISVTSITGLVSDCLYVLYGLTIGIMSPLDALSVIPPQTTLISNESSKLQEKIVPWPYEPKINK
jgi:hypothetical protein